MAGNLVEYHADEHRGNLRQVSVKSPSWPEEEEGRTASGKSVGLLLNEWVYDDDAAAAVGHSMVVQSVAKWAVISILHGRSCV